MNVGNVIDALQLSALSYSEIQPKSHGDIYIIDDKASDVQCFLRKYGDVLIITFRGSNSKTDWKHNLMFGQKIIPYGNEKSKIRVHKGFLKAYKSAGVRDVIHSHITNDIYKIKICGHSLGAALSTLCAVDLQYNFPHKDYEVILFGSPRVGNKAFVHSYNKRVFKTLQVQNGNDAVTKLPFKFLDYRHVGIKIHIGVADIPFVYSFKDHYPQKYYSNFFTQFKPQK